MPADEGREEDVHFLSEKLELKAGFILTDKEVWNDERVRRRVRISLWVKRGEDSRVEVRQRDVSPTQRVPRVTITLHGEVLEPSY